MMLHKTLSHLIATLALLLGLAAVSPSWSQRPEGYWDLGKKGEWLLDSAQTMHFEGLAADWPEVTHTRSELSIVGSATPRVYWVRLPLPIADLTLPQECYLIFSQYVDSVTVWRPLADGRWEQSAGGAALQLTATSSTPMRNKVSVLPITLHPTDSVLYARLVYRTLISREMGGLVADLTTRNRFNSDLNQELSITNRVWGMLLVMTLFNLVMGILNRDRVQGWLVLNLLCDLAFFTTFNGLWPVQSLPPFWLHLSRYADIWFAASGLVVFLVFFYHYLDLPKHLPRAARTTQWLGIAIVANVLLAVSWAYYYLNLVQSLLTLLLVVFTFVTSFRVYRRGYEPAKHMLLASLISIVGLFVFVLAIMAVIPYSTSANHVFYIGESFRAMVFALGVALRFNLLKSELAAKELEKQRIISDQERKITQLLEYQNAQLAEQVRLQTQALATEKENLEKANQVKNQLFSIIAHDLRSPLSALKGLMLLIGMGKLEKAQLADLALQVENRVSETINLADNLLHWARTQLEGFVVQPVVFNLRQSVENVSLVLQMEADKKEIRLLNQVPATVSLQADQQMIELVVRNLVANAIKFTPKNKEIVIRAGADDAQAWWEVIDRGVGISPEDQEGLFDMKVHHSDRGTEQEVGTGIGLMLCKTLLDLHNGHIRVDSQPGQGSTFRVTLPRVFQSPNKE